MLPCRHVMPRAVGLRILQEALALSERNHPVPARSEHLMQPAPLAIRRSGFEPGMPASRPKP
jgi:hypothetical protein